MSSCLPRHPTVANLSHIPRAALQLHNVSFPCKHIQGGEHGCLNSPRTLPALLSEGRIRRSLLGLPRNGFLWTVTTTLVALLHEWREWGGRGAEEAEERARKAPSGGCGNSSGGNQLVIGREGCLSDLPLLPARCCCCLAGNAGMLASHAAEKKCAAAASAQLGPKGQYARPLHPQTSVCPTSPPAVFFPLPNPEYPSPRAPPPFA